MIDITSAQNPVIKELKALKQKKYREEKQEFYIEGNRFVDDAICNNIRINRAFVSEGFLDSRAGLELIDKLETVCPCIYQISDKLMREISDTETPQGVVAVLGMQKVSLEEVLKTAKLVIALDAVQDPGNMGTIIRTADAAGVDCILLSKGCVDLYNPKVLRSTMGSVFHVPIVQNADLEQELELLKENGLKVLAAHLKGEKSCFEAELGSKIAIIIGNEANGISEPVANKADILVKIPIVGRAESLNASVAAAVLMYEVVRRSMNFL